MHDRIALQPGRSRAIIMIGRAAAPLSIIIAAGAPSPGVPVRRTRLSRGRGKWDYGAGVSPPSPL
jgi:hypothetical protein